MRDTENKIYDMNSWTTKENSELLLICNSRSSATVYMVKTKIQIG